MKRLSHAVPIEFSKMSLLKHFRQILLKSELYQLDLVLHHLLVPSPEHGVVQKAAIPFAKPTAIFPVLIQMPSKEHEG